MRKLFLFIAMSLDGFIAGQDDNLDFLSVVEKPGEDYGYGEFIHSVDTVIMGRRTYDKVMSMVDEFPHAGKESWVITRHPKPSRGKTHFYSGNLRELITRLKGQEGADIFCDGGAEIVNELLKDKLFDELIISVIPVLLGKGTMLFKPERPEQNLQLRSVKHFEKGLVQLHYSVK